MAGDFYLTAPSKRDITRRLRDEQRREVRWWWDLVMPLLALLVGLAGVMTSQCPARPTNQIIVGSEPRN
jgi:hypothetical protein